MCTATRESSLFSSMVAPAAVPCLTYNPDGYRRIMAKLTQHGRANVYSHEGGEPIRFGMDGFLDANPHWVRAVLRDTSGNSHVVWQCALPSLSARETFFAGIQSKHELIKAYMLGTTFESLPPGGITKAKVDSVVIRTLRVADKVFHLVRQSKYPLGRGSFFQAQGMALFNAEGELLADQAAFLKPVDKGVPSESVLEQIWNRTLSLPAQYYRDSPHVHTQEMPLFDKKRNTWFLIAPLAEKSGSELIRDPKEFIQMCGDLARGLWDIHRIGYRAGDIKRANTLCFKGLWKLSDLGLTLGGGRRPLTQTLAYISPQHRLFLQSKFRNFHRGCEGLLKECEPFLNHPAVAYDVTSEDEVFSLGVCFIEVYFAPLKEDSPSFAPQVIDAIAPLIERMTGVNIRLFATFRDVINAIDPVAKDVKRDSRLGESYDDPTKRPSALEISEEFRKIGV